MWETWGHTVPEPLLFKCSWSETKQLRNSNTQDQERKPRISRRKDAVEGAGQLTHRRVLQHSMCLKHPSVLSILRMQATGRTPCIFFTSQQEALTRRCSVICPATMPGLPKSYFQEQPLTKVMENVFPKYAWHQWAHPRLWVGGSALGGREAPWAFRGSLRTHGYPIIMQTLLTSSQHGSVSLAGIWRQSTQKRGAFVGSTAEKWNYQILLSLSLFSNQEEEGVKQ